MRSRDLVRQHQVIHSLLSRIGAACGDDIEMQAHWARYLCVLCAGFLENAVRGVYGDFAGRTASPAVASYVMYQLRQLQNPKTPRILDIAGQFRESWRVELERFVDERGRREAIDSIMQNRHLIAHGQHSAITIVAVRTYLGRAVEVLEFVEQQCV